MGEHADEIVARIYERMGEDEEPEDFIPSKRIGSNRVVCRFCGMADCHWTLTNQGKYRLADSQNLIHSCNQYKR